MQLHATPQGPSRCALVNPNQNLKLTHFKTIISINRPLTKTNQTLKNQLFFVPRLMKLKIMEQNWKMRRPRTSSADADADTDADADADADANADDELVLAGCALAGRIIANEGSGVSHILYLIQGSVTITLKDDPTKCVTLSASTANLSGMPVRGYWIGADAFLGTEGSSWMHTVTAANKTSNLSEDCIVLKVHPTVLYRAVPPQRLNSWWIAMTSSRSIELKFKHFYIRVLETSAGEGDAVLGRSPRNSHSDL